MVQVLEIVLTTKMSSSPLVLLSLNVKSDQLDTRLNLFQLPVQIAVPVKASKVRRARF